MKLHGNARTCPRSRRLLVERVEAGWPLGRAAAAAGVSVRTAAKWCARWQAEGEQGLLDRSSRPLRQPRRTPADRVEAVLRLRRLRMTAAGIAEVLRMALSTVSLILKRAGLGRRSPVGAAPAGQPLRASAAGRARPPRHREARPASTVPATCSSARPRTLRDRRRLRVPARLRRRLQPPRVRRAASRRAWCNSRCLPRADRHALRRSRRQDRASAHRQRQRLSLKTLP